MFLNRNALSAVLVSASILMILGGGCSGKRNIAAKRPANGSGAASATATETQPAYPTVKSTTPPAAAVAAPTAAVAAKPAASTIKPPASPSSVRAAPEAYTPNQTQWLDFGPLPGVKYAIYDGDPTSASIYTMRLKFPDGYKMSPHFHPRTERITVISGTLNVGSGDRFNQAATVAVPTGGFIAMGADVHYFVWTQGETILQLTGLGPWEIKYIDPKENAPAKKK